MPWKMPSSSTGPEGATSHFFSFSLLPFSTGDICGGQGASREIRGFRDGLLAQESSLGWRTCVTLEIRAPGTSWSSRLRLALFLLSLWWAHGTKNSRGRSRVCLQTVIRLGGRPDAHTHTLRNPDPVSGAASDVVRGVQTAKLGIKESIRVRAVSLDERRFES